ncbi:4-alpha-glucanotransferase, partial [gut metagenome]
MKLTFRIMYHTRWGEDLRVILNQDEEHARPLATRDGNEWQGTFSFDFPATCEPISYCYGVFREGKCVKKEFGAIPHLFTCALSETTHVILDDSWRELPADNYRYSTAFNAAVHSELPSNLPDTATCGLAFRALCPGLHRQGKVLAVAGSCEALGNWDPSRALRMQEIAPHVWSACMDASSLSLPFEYKFIAVDEPSGGRVEWEVGGNRWCSIRPLEQGEMYFTTETEVLFSRSEKKIAGSAIPVFSLRSERGFGVGDFGDLKSYIDWAVYTHQRAVQILPINDTTITHTWQDSYPYNSISIYAFHPMYIDVRQLPALKDEDKAAEYEAERKELNALAQIDYERVNTVKRALLKDIFKQEGKQMLSSDEFTVFFRKNEEWLKPYALFSYLRDLYGTPDFSQWPAYRIYHPEEAEELCRKPEVLSEVEFYYFLQYVLHVQLLQAANHARSKGVILKGDIPIGISRGSVEAWVEPHYFNMNGQAGAPPDAFSTKGQNWGFPTYNWDVMEKDNYQWWRRRFAKMSEYFTAYRIDHILGFFRIWEIPSHSVHGLLGQFVPALPMSEDEIRSFGLNFQKAFMTEPFINDYMLDVMFGEKSREVKERFVEHVHHDIYRMKPEFDTQRKVEAFFEGKTDQESLDMKEGIYSLISNVLFVKDRKNPELYHPRISVQNDFIYQRLNAQEKEAFNKLYNHYFYQRHNQFWYEEAMKKLPVLTQSTSMLVCGEDLGMVP